MRCHLWLACVFPALYTAIRPIFKKFNVTTDLKSIYFINLDNMPTRRHHMESEMELLRMPGKRWTAVDYRRVLRGEFDHDFLKPQGLNVELFQNLPKVGNGTIATYLSHLTVLMQLAKELGPDELGIVMEDDIEISADWAMRLQKAIDMAPTDWEMLKLSGWGQARVDDMMNSSSPSHPILVSEHPNVTMTQKKSLFTVFTQAVKSIFIEDTDVTFFQVRAPFKEPARLNWGTMGWGTDTFYYAGTGAYIVRGSKVKNIVSHLRSQKITDVDSMFLKNGTTQIYEGWPHVFNLASLAYSGPGLHGHKAFDEVDAGTIVDPTSVGSTSGEETDSMQVLTSLEGEGKTEGKPGTTGQFLGAGLTGSSHGSHQASADNAYDLGDIDKASAMRVPIKAHISVQTQSSIGVSPRGRLTLRSEKPRSPSLRQDSLVVPEVSDNSYGHPAWLSKCGRIYLDIGSKIGVQVMKLFEPERYPGAPMLQLFDQAFGPPEDRTQASAFSGICALGMEPNPAHRDHLQKLQANYTSKGWNVHFYPFSAWKDEGTVAFDQVNVRTVSLADFVTSLPSHTVKLMKVDIEGAEYETVHRMLQKKTLCRGTVDQALIQTHAWGDVSEWKDDRLYAALQKHLAALDCGLGGAPTQAINMTDETFRNDFPEAEWKAGEALAPAAHLRSDRRENRILCILAILAASIVFYFGHLHVRGEAFLDWVPFKRGREKESDLGSSWQ